MSTKKKILGYSIGPLGSALLSLVSIPIIAWFYSIEDVARFSIFQTIVVLYTLVFSFGLDQAYIREYYDSKDKIKLLSQIIKGVIFPSLLFIIICTLFFKVAVSNFLYDKYTFIIFILTLAASFFSLLIRILSSIQRVKDQAFTYSLSQVLPKLFFLVILMLLTYTSNNIFENILWSQFIAVTLVLLYFIKINSKDLFLAMRQSVDRNIKEYYIFGFPLILTGIVIWGLKLADRFYLKMFSNLEQLGLYSMAISIASGVVIFSSVFNTIWAPLVYNWASSSDIKDLKIARKVEDLAFKAACILILITILMIPLARIAVIFLPEQYHNIYLIIPLCALAPLLYTLSEITGIGINLMKKTNYTLWSCLIAIVFHIALSIYIIPLYGAIGAAVSSGIAFYIFFLARSFFSNSIWLNIKLKKVYFLSSASLVISFLPILLWN